jgi:hypothetical protein
MKVYIVMIESIYSSHTQWDIDRTFSTMDAAKAYIAERKAEYKSYYDVPEFDIEVEEVLE